MALVGGCGEVEGTEMSAKEGGPWGFYPRNLELDGYLPLALHWLKTAARV